MFSMPQVYPDFGILQPPHTGFFWEQSCGMTKARSSRQTLSENLKALMAAHLSLNTFAKIVAAGGPTNGTLDRIRRMESGASIDQLDNLAKVFGLEPWQLLVPDLDPTNPPMLAHVTQRQLEMLERIRQAAKELS
jgi:transcriptional regulator with XRE-family HTH domain